MSKTAAEYVDIKQLKPWDKNPRKNDHAVIEVKQSIQRFGFSAPIIARKSDNVIIAGHTRWKAAKEIGLKEVPVRFMDLDVVDSQLLAIADNKLNERADWDEDLLEQVLQDLAGEDLSGIGFDDNELQDIIDKVSDTDPKEENEDLPELEEEVHSKEGEIYELGPHRLLCEDSTKKENWDLVLIESEYSILTDPPYGISANTQTLGKGKKEFYRGENWDKKVPCLDLIIKDTCKKILWGANYYCHQLPQNNQWLIWHKKNDGRSFSECELAWRYLRKNVRILSHHWSGEEKVHPTQKPLPVMVWCIEYLESKVIFDPFGGSGTTLIAADKLNRYARLIELDPRYCDVIRRRWTRYAIENGLEVGSGGLE